MALIHIFMRRSHDYKLLFILLLIPLLFNCQGQRELAVDDRAGLLSADQTERLLDLRRFLLKEQDIELVIITLDRKSSDLNQTTAELFEKHRIGSRTSGARGLLLTIDPKGRQARIEVGYDLEGIFPDGFIASLQYDQMLPFFQSGRIGHGIEALTELLVTQLHAQRGSPPPRSGNTTHLSGGGGSTINTDAGDPTDIPTNTGATYLPQPTPLATLMQYRDSLANRNKNPDLAIYTPETRQFFRDWLVTDAQQGNALRELESALAAAETIELDQYAVIRFPVKNRQASPYFLKSSQAGWQLDFATMSRTIRFNHRNQWHLVTYDHPYMDAFKDYHFDQHGFPHKE